MRITQLALALVATAAAAASGSALPTPLPAAPLEARQAPTVTVVTVSGTPTTLTVEPSPTGLGDCHLHVDHWHCDGETHAEGEEHEGHDHAAEEHAGHDHAAEEGHAHSEDEHAGHDHAGHDHAGHSHAGHSHGPSAEFGCGLAPLEDYDLGLHIGAIFILLVASAIGTFFPIAVHRRPSSSSSSSFGDSDDDAAESGLLGKLFFVFKHFGTGIIISTAFIHLLSHAMLYFANECVGELQFESTGPAITMGAIWLVFVIDFFLLKSIRARALNSSAAAAAAAAPSIDEEGKGALDTASSSSHGQAVGPTEAQRNAATVQRVDLYMLEAAIVAHSILIGVTLGAATGAGWTALLIAITFHQFFEAIALGSRIALLPSFAASTLAKVGMGLAFVFTTPIGIAIGVGVRRSFNSNNATTLITMGTLHALSAGVLIYTALVELLSGDFIHNRRMLTSSNLKAAVAILAVTIGAAAMSVLGKWA